MAKQRRRMPGKETRQINDNVDSTPISIERFMDAPKRDSFVGRSGKIVAVGVVAGFTILGPIASTHSDAAPGKAQISALVGSPVQSNDTSICVGRQSLIPGCQSCQNALNISCLIDISCLGCHVSTFDPCIIGSFSPFCLPHHPCSGNQVPIE